MPAPGQLLWDAGAGAGSVGIEWMRAHPSCRTDRHRVRPRSAHPDLSERSRPGRSGPSGGRRSSTRRPCQSRVPGRDLHRRWRHPRRRPRHLLRGAEARRPPRRPRRHPRDRDPACQGVRRPRRRAHPYWRRDCRPVGTFTGWTPARTVTQWAWVKDGIEAPDQRLFAQIDAPPVLHVHLGLLRNGLGRQPRRRSLRQHAEPVFADTGCDHPTHYAPCLPSRGPRCGCQPAVGTTWHSCRMTVSGTPASAVLPRALDLLATLGYGPDLVERDYRVWMGVETRTADAVLFSRYLPKDISTSAIVLGFRRGCWA